MRLFIEMDMFPAMNSVISRSHYNWLIDSADTPMLFGDAGQDIARTPLPLPPNIGNAWFSSIQLPLNVVLRRVSHTFQPDITGRLIQFAHVTENMAEPVLCIQSLKTGRVVVNDTRVGEEFVFGPNGSMYQHSDRLDQVVKLDTSVDIEAFIVVMGRSVLNELLGEGMAESLLKGLHLTAMPSASVARIPLEVSNVLYSIFPAGLTGNIRKLFIQTRILEYISALTEHVGKATEAPELSPNKERNIQQLRDYLTHLDGKVPTMDELGKRYGMSPRLLNDEFKRYNAGQSIFSFIAEHRLIEARSALLQTGIPMKAIAARLGYSHVNNFINAFRNKFGCSPGSLRKKS